MRPMLLLSLLALLLAGCASRAAQSEPQRLLLAYDGPVAAAPDTPRPRLVVRGISLPDYLDRRELMRRSGPNTVEPLPGAVWAERPGKAMTRWVAQAIAAKRSDVTVEAYSTSDGRAPDAVLALTLERFEPGVDGVMRLRGSYVYALQGKPAMLSGRFDADAPMTAITAEASVAALQSALALAVQALVATLPPLVPASTTNR